MEIELKPYEVFTLDKFIGAIQRFEMDAYRKSENPDKPDTVIMHPKLARDLYIKCASLSVCPIDEKVFDDGKFKRREVTIHVMSNKIKLYTTLDISESKFIIK